MLVIAYGEVQVSPETLNSEAICVFPLYPSEQFIRERKSTMFNFISNS